MGDKAKRACRAEKRPDIRLPDGTIIIPRARWAKGIGMSDQTAAQLGVRTIYIATVAYVDPDEATSAAVKRGEHLHHLAKERRAG